MDKKFVILIGVFFVLFGLFISLIFFERPFIHLARAKFDQPSSDRSIIFAWPLQITADGQSTSDITVFIRTEKGDELGKRTVTLTSSIGQLVESTVTTDKLGKAEFKIRSQNTGIAEIKAIVDNSVPINQTIFIEFTSP